MTERDLELLPAAEPATPWVVVLGNEKGGTGKSTLALHIAVALLHSGQRVACLDLDARQGTLSHYLENRRRAAERQPLDLALPLYRGIAPTDESGCEIDPATASALFHQAMQDFADCDFIVIDTAGAAGRLATLAHSHADTLITPINDSLVDIETLAEVDLLQRQVQKPSRYARMVWQQSEARIARHQEAIDWIVVRNRLSHIGSRHKVDIFDLLTELARRIGFRTLGGVGERVIYRELFRQGLTLFDLPQIAGPLGLTASQRAALEEVEGLVREIGLYAGRPMQDPPDSFESGRVWRIKGHKEYLAEACRFAGLDPAAAMLQDVVDLHDRYVDDYFVEFPSPYCQTQAQFVYLIADLAQRRANFELEVRQIDRATNRTLHYSRLYPRLSKSTLDLLAQIDPAKARSLREANLRIEAVFERMRQELQLGPAPHWTPAED